MATNNFNQDQALGYYSSEYFSLDYKNDAGVYTPIPGVQDISFSGSTAPARDIISANTASQQKLGISRVGQVTANATYLPQDPTWRFLRDKQYDQTLVHFRCRWNAIVAFNSARTADAGAEVAISSAGVVTFTDGDSEAQPTIAGTPLGRGMLIRPKTVSSGADVLGAKGYLITSIDDTGAITAVDIDDYESPAEVSSTLFILYAPAPLQRLFSAYVSQGSDMEMGAESEMTTSLVLAPPVRLADAEVYLPSTT